MSIDSLKAPRTLPRSVVFDRTEFADSPHQQVSFFEDPSTGLKAIVAVHSTTRGPALGGTRFYPYPDEYSAVTDVLRLSRGMTYKAAVADVPLGGAKAVIIGDPRNMKTESLLESYGSFVDSLGGRYITAGDVGTTADDLDIIGRKTRHVVARNASAGGSGDSAPLTALGVLCAMRAVAAHRWGPAGLDGRTIGVEGAGKVGLQLIELLLAAGARVVASDVDSLALERLQDSFPAVEIAERVLTRDLDVYAPCAMGGTLTESSSRTLRASVVCGAANNQLQTPAADRALHERGVIWVPDFVANAGGLIQVAGELVGAPPESVRSDVEKIYTTVASLLQSAEALGISTSAAAQSLAAGRLAGG